MVQAVFFGLQSQVGDTVGHIHALGWVVGSARWRISCHGAVGKGLSCQDEISHFSLIMKIQSNAYSVAIHLIYVCDENAILFWGGYNFMRMTAFVAPHFLFKKIILYF